MDYLFFILLNIVLIAVTLFFCVKAPLLGMITSLLLLFIDFGVTELTYQNSTGFITRYVDLKELAPVIIIATILMLICGLRSYSEYKSDL